VSGEKCLGVEDGSRIEREKERERENALLLCFFVWLKKDKWEEAFCKWRTSGRVRENKRERRGIWENPLPRKSQSHLSVFYCAVFWNMIWFSTCWTARLDGRVKTWWFDKAREEREDEEEIVCFSVCMMVK